MEKKPSTNKTQGILETTHVTFRILSRYTNPFEKHSEPEIKAREFSRRRDTYPPIQENFCLRSYGRLTPSSSSSELSKMLSKSCREGAKSVTCVRLLEPALPAALSCRTSVGKETKDRMSNFITGEGVRRGHGSQWATPACEFFPYVFN